MIKITIEIENEEPVVLQSKMSYLVIEPKTTADPLFRKPKIKPIKNLVKSIKLPKGLKICPRCDKPFKPKGNRQKYCSELCGMKPKSEKEKTKHILSKKISIFEKEIDQAIEESEDIRDFTKKVIEVKTITPEQIERSKDHLYNS